MGHGVLQVDYATLKAALFLPEDCKIVSTVPATVYGQPSVGFVIASPSIPEAEHVWPLSAISMQEIPEKHECPDGFQCKKISTRLEVKPY